MKNNFKFITKDNIEITYYTDKSNNKWFDALIIIEYLEYEEPKEILKDNKIKKYIKKYEEIFNDKKNKSNLKIISESGIFRLLLNSNQKDAIVFQEWLVDDVLMNLQKNNEYVLTKNNIKKFLT
jgi:prophage antirepressor-like protein